MHSIDVPLELILDLTLPADARLAAVVMRAVAVHDRADKSEAELARLCGFRSPRTLRRQVRLLATRGWIEVRPGADRRRRVYIFHDLPAERELRDVEAIRRRVEHSPYLGEAIAAEWIRLFSRVYEFTLHARPEFLVHPVTGALMEYDVWFPSVRVAFDFNGTAHDGPMDDDPTGTRFRWRQALDLVKRPLSEDNGVRLVVIRTEDLTYARMKELVASALPVRDVPPDHPAARYLEAVSKEYVASQTRRRR